MNASERLRLLLKTYRWLVPYWDKHLIVFVCSVCLLFLQVAAPYLSKLVIDQAIVKGDAVVFFRLLWVGLIVFLASMLLGGLQSYLSFYTSVRIGYDVRSHYFGTLVRKPLGFFDGKSTGELLFRLNADPSSVVGLASGGIQGLVLTLLQVGFLLVICFRWEWRATAVVVGVVPAFYLLNAWFGKLQYRMGDRVARASQRLSATVQDHLSNVRLHKYSRTESASLRAYCGEAVRQIRVLVESFRLGLLSSTTRQAGKYGLALGIASYLGGRVMHGDLSLGSFAALSAYLLHLSKVLQSLGSAYEGVASQFAYVERFFEVVSTAAGEGDTVPADARFLPKPGAPPLEVRDVHYAYARSRAVLRGATFRVGPGEWVAIVGESGQGKSTLVKMLLGLETPGRGEVMIWGVPAERLDPSVFRRHVGIVLQDPLVLNGTVECNVRFGAPSVPAEVVEEAMDVAGVRRIGRGPDGRGRAEGQGVGEGGALLSLGERQRIGIARALARRPRLLIVDEGTNQLEEGEEARILSEIRRRFPECAVLLLSCRPGIARFAQRVYVLAGGKMSEVMGGEGALGPGTSLAQAVGGER